MTFCSPFNVNNVNRRAMAEGAKPDIVCLQELNAPTHAPAWIQLEPPR